jgi:hypothetical protein
VLALLAALAFQHPQAARAESLLTAGALRDARRVAEQIVNQSPKDARAHLLLGRVWFAWPVFGRYHALKEFQTAARLAPRDPEPLYRQMEVGFFLGSDEGEVMARNAILGMLRLDPEYRDVWARFNELYRNPSIWRKADRALAHHPGSPSALERRALIAIALEEPRRADSLAALASALRGPSAALFLLRAEAAFLANRDAAGQAWHDSAVAYADRDSAAALWERAALVAGEDEVQAYERLQPGGRRGFFSVFWGTRDPNLVTGLNERLGEQARRVAEARRLFRLLHPQRMWYRSSAFRALAWFDEKRWLFELASVAPELVGEGHTGAAASRAAMLDYQSFQDTAATLAYRAGLDARGLTFVRHGKPDVRAACTPDPLVPIADPRCSSIFDGEGWLYYTPEGPRSISFRGAEYFAPVTGRQLRSIRTLLRTDRSVLPAPLETTSAVAFFLGPATGYADVYYRVGGDTAAVVLWQRTGEESARRTGRDLLRVSVPAGEYRFGVDVDSSGLLSRSRGAVTVPWFDAGDLKLSSLILTANTANAEREASLRAMPPNLTFDAGASLSAYTEVYGLAGAEVAGRIRYRARYTFAPERSLVGRVLRGSDSVSFEFERNAETGPMVVERLLLEPGRVPAGRYRVTLAVTDVARNVKSETVAIVVTIR